VPERLARSCCRLIEGQRSDPDIVAARMRELSPEELLGELRESVELLAATPTQQEEWLHEHRFPVDELALQLDDEVPAWFPRLASAGLLTDDAQEALRDLNAALAQFSGSQNASLWTERALHDAPEWRKVRDLAARAFAALPCS